MRGLYLAFKVRIIDYLERFLRKIGCTLYYTNKYGVKVLNRKTKRKGVRSNVVVVELEPSELLLPYDCLKDSYTLLGTRIEDSPHIDLMRGCMAGNLKNNCYLQKAEQGTLDGRDSVFCSSDDYIRFFYSTLDRFQKGQIEPIRFYVVDGKRYIADGKHRAALAASIGKTIVGYEVPCEQLQSESTEKLLSIMKKRSTDFSRNIEHLNKVFLSCDSGNRDNLRRKNV